MKTNSHSLCLGPQISLIKVMVGKLCLVLVLLVQYLNFQRSVNCYLEQITIINQELYFFLPKINLSIRKISCQEMEGKETVLIVKVVKSYTMILTLAVIQEIYPKMLGSNQSTKLAIINHIHNVIPADMATALIIKTKIKIKIN